MTEDHLILLKILAFALTFAFCMFMIIQGAKASTSDLKYLQDTGRVSCRAGVLSTLALFFFITMYSSYCGAKKGIKEYLSGKQEVVYIYDNDSIPVDTIININFIKYTENLYK